MLQRPRHRCEGTAVGSIVFDLRPGLGIGPFSLGMPICEAFTQIEQQSDIYDVVHVKYLDEEPLKLDIVISFPDHGFHLCFNPWSQRLRLIEIFDVKRLQMCYATSLIGAYHLLTQFHPNIRIAVMMEGLSCRWSFQTALLQLHAVSLYMTVLQIVKLAPVL